MGSSVEYHRPGSLSEACDLLHTLGADAVPLAGGTDVIVELRRGPKRPSHLVSLADLNELREIALENGKLRIGALVTPAQMEASKDVLSSRPELMDVVGVFGTPQVRNRATVGGNLCTAASCGDMAPLLMVLGARVVVATPEGARDLSMEEFFGDHRRTVLEPGHILSEVIVPARVPGEGAAYRAFGLRATNFITVAGAAAYLKVDGARCTEARLALGAVAPTPFLVPGAAQVLVGTDLRDKDLANVGLAAGAAATPISDVRGSAEHRRELVIRLCVRALRAARERAQ
ncbi:MAG: xanthine dehydrogenase family protein subunit M [Gemmatimonadota bacterium]